MPHEVTLTLRQSAALGRRPRGSAPVETYRHLPGSVLRGALAAAWIRDFGPPQGNVRRGEFVRLFEGGVRYGPLFDPHSAVVPLSVLRCKYRPARRCDASYTDRTVTPGDRPRCGNCGGPMVAGRGEVEYFGVPAPVVEHTRTALDEDERAAERLLFTRRSLGHRQDSGASRTLVGQITVPEGTAGADWLEVERQLFIGGRRSISGASMYAVSAAPVAPGAASGGRDGGSERGRVPHPGPDALVIDGRLTVRLISPALLVNAAGRPATVPDTGLIGALLGTDVTVDQNVCWTRRERVGGWNAQANIPKPEEIAVSAGSVFQLRLGSTPTAGALEALRDHGLGLRRAEGFGCVEFGPWTLPPLAAEAEVFQPENLYTGMARQLYESGSGAKCLKWLTECARRRRQGERGTDAFWKLPSAEGVRLDTRLTRYLRSVLHTPDVRELERILLHLEAHVREGRR